MNLKSPPPFDKSIPSLLFFILLISPMIAGEIWPRETRTHLIVTTILNLAFFSYLGILVFPVLLETRSKNINIVLLVLFGITLIMLTIRMFVDYNKHFLTIVMVLLAIAILATEPKARAFFTRLGRSLGLGSQRG